MLLRRALSTAAAAVGGSPRSARALVVGGSASDGLRRTVAAAAQCAPVGVDVLLTGGGETCAAAAARWAGVRAVLSASAPRAPAEVLAPLVVDRVHGGGYGFVVGEACAAGRDLLPRVAGMLDVSPIGDVTKVVGGDGGGGVDTFERGIYAGNVVATVRSTDGVKVVTVRPTSFEAVGDVEEGVDGGAVEEVDVSEYVAANTRSAWVGEEKASSARPELGSARVVVSGGRGMKSAAGLELVCGLADALGGAVGATRAAVDAGMVANELQVGQTGKIVAPQLYVAVGLSGAIQHVAGMKDSGVIVAINKDADAPICALADYTLVGDMFEIVPQLQAKLEALGVGAGAGE